MTNTRDAAAAALASLHQTASSLKGDALQAFVDSLATSLSAQVDVANAAIKQHCDDGGPVSELCRGAISAGRVSDLLEVLDYCRDQLGVPATCTDSTLRLGVFVHCGEFMLVDSARRLAEAAGE